MNAYFFTKPQSSYSIKPHHITNALRHAATSLQATTGIEPSLLSGRSLRPGGATALLLAGVSTNHIGLLGRWKSDAMFTYLRIQAATQRSNFAQRMLDHGRYTFAPGTYAQRDALPTEAPPVLHELLQHTELYTFNSHPISVPPYSACGSGQATVDIPSTMAMAPGRLAPTRESPAPRSTEDGRP